MFVSIVKANAKNNAKNNSSQGGALTIGDSV